MNTHEVIRTTVEFSNDPQHGQLTVAKAFIRIDVSAVDGVEGTRLYNALPRFITHEGFRLERYSINREALEVGYRSHEMIQPLTQTPKD